MALSSVTVSIDARTVFGNKRVVFASVSLGNDTFPSGGISLTPSQFGLQHVDLVLFEGKKLAYYYDYDNEKINAYLPGSSTGASEVRVAANGATPNETIKAIVIGYGG